MYLMNNALLKIFDAQNQQQNTIQSLTLFLA